MLRSYVLLLSSSFVMLMYITHCEDVTFICVTAVLIICHVDVRCWNVTLLSLTRLQVQCSAASAATRVASEPGKRTTEEC